MIDIFYTKPEFQDNLTLLLRPFFDFYKFVHTFSLFCRKPILKSYQSGDIIRFSHNILHVYSIRPSEGLTALRLKIPFEEFILLLNFLSIQDSQTYCNISLHYQKSLFKFIDINCLFTGQVNPAFPLSASLVYRVNRYHDHYYDPDLIWFQLTTHGNDLILVKKNSDVNAYRLLSKKTINKYEKAWNNLLQFDMLLLFKKIFKDIYLNI